jgi:hypothetical protein
MSDRGPWAEESHVSRPASSTRMRAFIVLGVALSLCAEFLVIGAGYSYAVISGVLLGVRRSSRTAGAAV